LVAGLETVTEGEIRLGSTLLNDLEPARRDIAMVFQNYALYPHMSAFDNMAYSLRIAGLPRAQIEARVQKAAAALGLGELLDRRPGQLSGGQRQRLAIARAFLTDPKILILDDSTSAIDSATEDRIQKAIWAAAQGRTTLLVTHRLSQIRWADHIIVIKNGEVVAQGKHDDLLESSQAYRRIFARYESRETAAEGEVR
jgi:ABC-type sugar transport system ATPase subunit